MIPGRGIYIGRFLDIPVYIHVSWFFILAFLAFHWTYYFADYAAVPVSAAFVVGLTASLAAFASLLAHEYGHALAARYYGIPTQSITLFLLGGVAQIKGEARRPMEEFVIAVAGPAVSILCAILFGIFTVGAHFLGAPALLVVGLQSVALVNIVFAVFNMIPGFPMDGGRVLRAIVWGITGNYLSSTRTATFIGKIFAGTMVGLGTLLVLNGVLVGLMLMLTGVFIFSIAHMSLKQAELKTAFDNLHVRDIMRPVQVVVPAETPIRDVIRDFVYRIHTDRFPVVRGDSLIGYLSTDDIAHLSSDQWDRHRAEGFARPYRFSEVLNPDQDLFSAMEKAQSSGRSEIPVFRGRRLVGFLLVNDLMTHMQQRVGRIL